MGLGLVLTIDPSTDAVCRRGTDTVRISCADVTKPRDFRVPIFVGDVKVGFFLLVRHRSVRSKKVLIALPEEWRITRESWHDKGRSPV